MIVLVLVRIKGKKCYLSGNFCARTKWMILSIKRTMTTACWLNIIFINHGQRAELNIFQYFSISFKKKNNDKLVSVNSVTKRSMDLAEVRDKRPEKFFTNFLFLLDLSLSSKSVYMIIQNLK